jgi:hypothetical protein
VKTGHRHPTRLLQPLPILEWKWEVATVDFITKLPKIVKHHDSIMVVVDKLTKATHCILVKTAHKATNIAEIYMKEVASLDGVPIAIVSDRDLERFVQGIWNKFKSQYNVSPRIRWEKRED